MPSGDLLLESANDRARRSASLKDFFKYLSDYKVAVMVLLVLVAVGISFIVPPAMPALFAVIFTPLQWQAIVSVSFALVVPGFWLYSATLNTGQNDLYGDYSFWSVCKNHLKFFAKLMLSTLLMMPFFMVIMPGSMLAVTVGLVKPNFAVITATQALGMSAAQLKAYTVATVTKVWLGVIGGAGLSSALMSAWHLLGTLFIAASAFVALKKWRRLASGLYYFGKGMVFFSWSFMGICWAKLAVLGNQLLDLTAKGMDALLKLADLKDVFYAGADAVAQAFAAAGERFLSWFGIYGSAAPPAGPGVWQAISEAIRHFFSASGDAAAAGIHAIPALQTSEVITGTSEAFANAVPRALGVTLTGAGTFGALGFFAGKGDDTVIERDPLVSQM